MAYDWSNIEERVAVAIEQMMLAAAAAPLEPRIMGVLRDLDSDPTFPPDGKKRVAELIEVLSLIQGPSGADGAGPERQRLIRERMVGFLRYVAHEGAWP
ncbi:MAG: hypothetical protein IT375_20305 [Polyangiaceae bacterium]|nr:hypothetical protein [Polyangiaceae bacterium]